MANISTNDQDPNVPRLDVKGEPWKPQPNKFVKGEIMARHDNEKTVSLDTFASDQETFTGEPMGMGLNAGKSSE